MFDHLAMPDLQASALSPRAGSFVWAPAHAMPAVECVLWNVHRRMHGVRAAACAERARLSVAFHLCAVPRGPKRPFRAAGDVICDAMKMPHAYGEEAPAFSCCECSSLACAMRRGRQSPEDRSKQTHMTHCYDQYCYCCYTICTIILLLLAEHSPSGWWGQTEPADTGTHVYGLLACRSSGLCCRSLTYLDTTQDTYTYTAQDTRWGTQWAATNEAN